MAVSNEKATFGVCPYGDGSGFKFDIEADANNGDPLVRIKQVDNWLYLRRDEWLHLASAIDRAFYFIDNPAIETKGETPK